jgi:two-component system, NarL family, sensor histidine kinase DesK
MHDKIAGQTEMSHDLYGRPHCARKHDFGSYVWLAYSIFFFIQPIFERNLKYWIEQGAIYAVFLALYVAYVEFEAPRIRLPLIGAMFVLGAASLPFNTGGSCFFIYVMALLPFCVESMTVLVSVMAVEAVTLFSEGYLTHRNPFDYAITGFFAVVVGVSNVFVAQRKRADAKLRAAQQENAALAAVAERERIARDLHDVLGHTLSVIVLKAELAGRLMGRDDARAAAEIADVERTARTALAEVREAIGGYRAQGLRAEVDQARRTLDAAGVSLVCDSAPPQLKARGETALSLAVREAVTNIVRHAHATTCTMRFATAEDGFCLLEIQDNGTAGILREGNGLRGMRERVQELGGRFRIEASGGTKLVIEVPGQKQEQGQERPNAGRAPLRGVMDASRVVGKA